MNTLVSAKLYVRPNGYVGTVLLGVFDNGPVGLDISIECGIPLVGCCAQIEEVSDPEHPVTHLIDFAASIELASVKIVEALSKLGCHIITDSSDLVIIETSRSI